MNRLTRIGIDGFRSLSDCEIRFPDNEQNALLCLVGKNGSGKSAVLHALDFAGQMFRGDISSWLAERNWQAGDLVPSARQGMLHFAIDGVVAGQAFGWSSALDPATLKCVREELRMDGRRVFELSDKGLAIKGRNVLSAAHESTGTDAEQPGVHEIFANEGSFLSTLSDKFLQACGLLEVVRFLKGMAFQETQNVHLLRQRSRKADRTDDAGRGKTSLACRVAALSASDRQRLLEKMQGFFPWIAGIRIVSLPGGTRELVFREQDESGSAPARREVPAAQAGDGLLRLTALLCALLSSDTVLAVNEIENGLHPEMIGQLVQELRSSGKQIVFTTHSPVVVNALPDDVARESVLLVLRKSLGSTGICRFFWALRGYLWVRAPIPSLAFSPGTISISEGSCHCPHCKDIFREFINSI